MKLNQRSAVAVSFGWDLSDVDEYQPGHTSGRYGSPPVKVFSAGDGYAVALKADRRMPRELLEYPWKIREHLGGWTIWTAGL